MKKLLLLLLLFNTSLLAFDEEVFKRAIAEIETGNIVNWQIGKDGERTKYQFMETTWQQYSDFPFDKLYWHDQEATEEAERVMDKHVTRIKYVMMDNIAMGIYLDREAFWLAMIHNGGESRVINKAWRSRHIDYAKRVENLYEFYLTKTKKKVRYEYVY